MPKKKDKILLHICCAGCGAYVADVLKEGFEVCLYFSNPNIFPEKEYDKRKKEVEMIAKKFELSLLVDVYDHRDWLHFTKGLETEPEKGKRCFLCYKYRLKRLAETAVSRGISVFSTSLSVSPYKEYEYIRQIGEALASRYGLSFYAQDFKKKDGFRNSLKLSKELGLYRQNYCGCEFSIKN